MCKMQFYGIKAGGSRPFRCAGKQFWDLLDLFQGEVFYFLPIAAPGDLEEMYLPYYAEKARGKNSPVVQMQKHGKDLALDTDELFQIDSDIKGQVYARDFMLIDQSDMIISFIPAVADGSPAISSGVERELQHAYEGAKEVYVIWTSEKEPSVFVTQTATKVFKDEAEAIEFFTKKKYIK